MPSGRSYDGYGVTLWKNKPDRLLPTLAKPDTRLVIANGNVPVLEKPETPVPRLEKPENTLP
nr:hypothetical protein [Mycobacterium marinum]